MFKLNKTGCNYVIVNIFYYTKYDQDQSDSSILQGHLGAEWL